MFDDFPLLLVNLPILDRLKAAISAWHDIKANKFIIHVIQHGIDLDFVAGHPPANVPVSYRITEEVEKAAWIKQLNRFKAIGCVRRLRPEELGSAVFAPMFVTPKKDSPEFWCIYDMRYVNRFIRYKHFKNEGLHTVRDILRWNDFMTKVDVQDAYFHCPVKFAHHKYMAFVDDNKIYWCFKVLPFGLTSAPRWFTKVMREVISFVLWCWS